MQFRRKNRVRGLPIETLEGRVLLSTQTFIFPPPGPVTGVVYFDVNGNDAFDAGENALAGVTVFEDVNLNGLLDVGENSSISDAGGQYSLSSGASVDHLRVLPARGYVMPNLNLFTWPSINTLDIGLVTTPILR